MLPKQYGSVECWEAKGGEKSKVIRTSVKYKSMQVRVEIIFLVRDFGALGDE